jgi:hypothetical protein
MCNTLQNAALQAVLRKRHWEDWVLRNSPIDRDRHLEHIQEVPSMVQDDNVSFL